MNKRAQILFSAAEVQQNSLKTALRIMILCSVFDKESIRFSENVTTFKPSVAVVQGNNCGRLYFIVLLKDTIIKVWAVNSLYSEDDLLSREIVPVT